MGIVTVVDGTCTWGRCESLGTYSLQVVCSNCSWSGRIDLTRGHEFSPRSNECPACGCKRLMRKPSDV